MKKSQKGFTLVELIVVIAIIGVLAAILVPSMMGYVKKSKLKSANSNAKLVFTTANSALSDCVVEGKIPTGTSFASTSGDLAADFQVASPTTADDILTNSIYEALKDNGDGAGCVYVELDTNKSSVSFAQWANDSTQTTLGGQYPDPNDDPDDAFTWGSKMN